MSVLSLKQIGVATPSQEAYFECVATESICDRAVNHAILYGARVSSATINGDPSGEVGTVVAVTVNTTVTPPGMVSYVTYKVQFRQGNPVLMQPLQLFQGLLLFLDRAKDENSGITEDETNQTVRHIAHLTELSKEVRNANVLGLPVSFRIPENHSDDGNKVLVGVITGFRFPKHRPKWVVTFNETGTIEQFDEDDIRQAIKLHRNLSEACSGNTTARRGSELGAQQDNQENNVDVSADIPLTPSS